MNQQNIDQVAKRLLATQIPLERVFGKLTEKARRALAFADEEAALLHHNYIGTEHLLLGLLREHSGLAAHVLASFHIELAAVRVIVEQTVGRGDESIPIAERSMTPRTLVTLLMALGETSRSSFIGTEHLLLGILREGEGVAAVVIENLAPLDQIRTRVYQFVLNQAGVGESLKEIVKSKSNVVTCRITNEDMSAIDSLVEVGIRSTRSDASSWLIHAGIEANQPIFERVYATVTQIRQLRTQAQAMVQQVKSSDSGETETVGSVEQG